MPIIGMAAPRFFAIGPAIIGVFGLLAYRPIMGRWPRFCKSTCISMGIIIAALWASFFWAYDTDLVIERASKTSLLLLGITAFVSLLQSMTAQQLRPFVRIFPIAVIISGFIVVIDLYSAGGVYRLLHPDLQGRLNLSNLNRSVIIFEFSALAALFGLIRGIKICKMSRILSLILVVLLALVWLETQSQSAQLAILLAAAAFIIFPIIPAQKLWAWRVVQAIIIALIFTTPFIVPWAFDNFAAIMSENKWLSHGYAPQRLEIWDYISRRALESPIIGHGVEATQAIKDFDSALIYTPINYVLHPHNFVVQLWIEFGVLGAALGSAFLCFIVEQIRKSSERLARSFFALFVAALSIGSIAYGLWQGWWLGLLAFLVVISLISQKIASKG